MSMPTRNGLEQMDRMDPLRSFRQEFLVPEGIVYLDGNSLGARPHAARERLLSVLDDQWGNDLVKSWNAHGWYRLPEHTGGSIAALIGAEADEVIVADSTSVNLFKLLIAALRMRPGRSEIVAETGDFPTNLYVAQGVAALLPGISLRIVDKAMLSEAVGPDTAAVMINHVGYRSGEINDMKEISALAHTHGTLIIWDLSHSAGVLPVRLNDCAVDLAVGCGYKYLNGGPGAPAYLYVSKRHQETIEPVITGWMGHVAPFEFDLDYRPAAGIRRNLSGTTPILSLAALDAGLEILIRAGVQSIREKSRRLGDAFILLSQPVMDEFGFSLVSPHDAERRGSQVALSHPDGYAIMQALIARGVVGDFRAPDTLRFGFAPLYNRYIDVWDAVAQLRAVMQNQEWKRPEFNRRQAVT